MEINLQEGGYHAERGSQLFCLPDHAEGYQTERGSQLFCLADSHWRLPRRAWEPVSQERVTQPKTRSHAPRGNAETA
ncbi:hypothetical protein BTA35_0204475 [Oceanospirillum linum]|uniref:Uncharacterized protein n=1 Tax=Oceanospirillum linum TaxID=966 RepID=A0A1T1HG72_OCELI|nr:hypothetical protein BTA35_0204475 [Oceanospirillum linum]